MSKYNRYKESANSKTKQEKANRHINFVVIVYVIILAYLLFLIYHSFTKEQIHFVYAEPGHIYNDGNFEGLIVRNEQVITADEAGPVKYFVPEGSKVRQGAYVCSVNQDPETERIIQEQINTHLSQLNNTMSLSVDDYRILQEKIKGYVLDKPDEPLDFVYASKDMIKKTILDISHTVYIKDQKLFEQVQKEIAINEEQRLSNGTFYKMPNGGVVGYNIDGFENLDIDALDFAALTGRLSSLDVSEEHTVIPGDPLYKIIDNYLYYIVSEIDSYGMKFLQNRLDRNQRYITLHFPRKNLEIIVKIYDLESDNGKNYVTFELDRYFDEFFNNRFIDFIIEYENYSGLKIPNESVAEKGLYKVPKSAIYEEKGSTKIQRKHYTDDNSTHEEIVPLTVKVYFEDDEFSYIDAMDEVQSIRPGDVILYTLDENARVSQSGEYKVEELVDVEGVYILNKGYSDFKRIETVYQADAFRIIANDAGYSVSMFDKVASDASEIKEFETVN